MEVDEEPGGEVVEGIINDNGDIERVVVKSVDRDKVRERHLLSNREMVRDKERHGERDLVIEGERDLVRDRERDLFRDLERVREKDMIRDIEWDLDRDRSSCKSRNSVNGENSNMVVEDDLEADLNVYGESEIGEVTELKACLKKNVNFPLYL